MGELEERQQARALPRAEAVAQLLEVTGQEPGRVAVPLARLVREPFGLGAREEYGVDQRRLELRQAGGHRLGACPDGEDHREARPLEPEAAEVVVRRRVLERALQRSVADQQLRVGL